MNIDYTRDTAKRYGFAAALHDLAYRAANRVTTFDVLEGVTLTMESLDKSYLTSIGDAAWGFLDRERLLARTRLQPTDMTEPFVEEALRRGDRCFGILDGETLASYGWYSTRPTDIGEGLTLHFDPAFAYMYSGFTLPAYRGKRLHGIGMAGAMAALCGEGKKGLVSYVRSTNFASMRSCERMGYTRFGSLIVVKLGSQHYAYATPGCRELRFRAEPTS